MTYVTKDEIHSQPEVWASVLELLSDRRDEFQERFNHEAQVENLFIGCGSSYYLGQCAASVFRHLTEVPSRAYPASEVNLFPESVIPPDGPVSPYFISRSGTTTEVLQACKTLKNRTSRPLSGVSCRSDGPLQDLVSHSYLISRADEESVVMTRSFTSMLLFLQGLSAIAVNDHAFLEQLHKLSENSKRIFQQGRDIADRMMRETNCSEFVFLGQGPFYGLARESALKLKEISLSHSDAYHSLEFRHGPRSLVNEDLLITCLISEQAREQEVKLMEELYETDATVFAICEQNGPRIEENSDYVFPLETGLDDYARLVLYLPVIQMIGYHKALENGVNPDAPSNLTQVVKL